MQLNEEQQKQVAAAELATAAGQPDLGAEIMGELIESVDPDDHEIRGRLSITRGHFLKAAGQFEAAIEVYLGAASLLEPIRGETVLEAAHAFYGAGLLLVNADHPDASKTTGHALALYQRYPFTRQADIADAAVMHLSAQAFIDKQVSESGFDSTWELVRESPPEAMTPGILEQWLLMVSSFLASVPEASRDDLAMDVREWAGAHGEDAETQPPASSDPAPDTTIPSAQLMAEIRAGYDELRQARENGVEFAQVEIEVIEMVLSLPDADAHPPLLLGGAFFSLGACFTELNDDTRAERYYRQSLACNPNNSSARYNLGNVLMRRGEEQTAADLFRQVVDEDPNNDFALRNLTYVLARLGEVATALDAAVSTALVADVPGVSAARLLELCTLYDAWSIGKPVVEQRLQNASAPAERVQQLRLLLAPLLEHD